MNDTAKDEMRERLGNIDQIRELLFGHKIKEYEQRFETCEQRLSSMESELSSFQLEIRDRLNQLKDSLSAEVRSTFSTLEKQLNYFNLTHQEEVSKLHQDIELMTQRNSHNLDSLHKSFTAQTIFL